MIIDGNTIFSLGGQVAQVATIHTESGEELRSLIQWDSNTKIAQCYELDEAGEPILPTEEDEIPMLATRRFEQLYFTVCLPTAEEVLGKPTSGGPA